MNIYLLNVETVNIILLLDSQISTDRTEYEWFFSSESDIRVFPVEKKKKSSQFILGEGYRKSTYSEFSIRFLVIHSET